MLLLLRWIRVKAIGNSWSLTRHDSTAEVAEADRNWQAIYTMARDVTAFSLVAMAVVDRPNLRQVRRRSLRTSATYRLISPYGRLALRSRYRQLTIVSHYSQRAFGARE